MSKEEMLRIIEEAAKNEAGRQAMRDQVKYQPHLEISKLCRQWLRANLSK